MFEQSILLSMVLAAAGGVLNVLATAVLAYPDAQRKKGIEWSRNAQAGALALNILLQFANSGANVFASFFGPVSIVLPTIVSSQLFFNMVMFGPLLRSEEFPKETRIGTYLVVLAVVLLPTVGPTVQEGQDILQLLLRPAAAVWCTLLITAMGVSFVGLVLISRRYSEGTMGGKSTASFIFNMVAQSSAGVLGVTLSKAFVLVEGQALVVAVLLWGTTGLVQLYAIILQATTVNQSTFVPCSTAANVSVNALTGILIWKDLTTIQSPVGYTCAFLLMIMGIYLLSDLDIFDRSSSAVGSVNPTETKMDDEITATSSSCPNCTLTPIDEENPVPFDRQIDEAINEETPAVLGPAEGDSCQV